MIDFFLGESKGKKISEKDYTLVFGELQKIDNDDFYHINNFIDEFYYIQEQNSIFNTFIRVHFFAPYKL